MLTKSKQLLRMKQFKYLFFSMFIAFSASYSSEAMKRIEDVFAESCWDCHDDLLQKGDVQLDNLTSDDTELMDKVFRAVRGGSMPPPKEKALSKELKAQLLEGLSEELSHDHHKHDTARRLTKHELLFSLEDIFGIRLKKGVKDSISDEQVDHGFDVSSHLGLTNHHLKKYLEVIQAVVDSAFEQKLKNPITVVSQKFKYDSHPKRKKIEVDGPFTEIKTQPRTANGTSFPYFRDGFVCEEEGYYDVEFECEPLSENSTVMLFSGVYYIDGAVVFKRPTLEECFYIDKKDKIKTRVYFHKGNELGFSAMHGTSFKMNNPVKITGPIVEEWPTSKMKKLLAVGKVNFKNGNWKVSENTEASLKACLSEFADTVLRKKVSKNDIQPHHTIALQSFKNGFSWLESLKIGYSSVLCSPKFLLIDSDKKESYRMSERLSFMFWKSIPDNTLKELAESNQLNKPDIFKREFKRILNDEKANRFMEDFCHQWLGFKGLQTISADYRLYPEFDIHLRNSMISETYETMKYMFQENKSLKDLIDSDYIFINEKLAKHYNIDNIKGEHFRKVSLPQKSERGGLLTQASLMMSTADGAATTPVKRGIWVLENFLNRYIPAPPKNIPGIEADIEGEMTVLEQLAIHRKSKDCRSCHVVIDAYGVAFESFDPFGQFRENYRVLGGKGKGTITFRYGKRYKLGDEVLADYDMPNGDTYKGIQGFKEEVKKETHRVYINLAEKFMSYAKGRGLGYEERLEIDKLGLAAYQENLGMKDFLLKLMLSDVFKRV